jgi:small-conductance mechanosensitive channel
MDSVANGWPQWLLAFAAITLPVVLAFVADWFLFSMLRRIADRHESVLMQSLVRHGRLPSFFILPLIALLAALPLAHLPANFQTFVERIIGLGLIAAIGWLVILASAIVFDLMSSRYRLDVANNLAARRTQTQIQMLHRIVVLIVSIVTLSVMLMTFPAIKHIGISLLASAGLAGLVIGTAMNRTISNLIAGVQIAFTQPIRLEDAVVVEGEWGWIEEIGTTYVVVRIWDLRRLILPLTYFLEHPFQNWTLNSADLLGSVFIQVDYTVPVDELRKELRRIVSTTDKWRGQVCVLQVTDATANGVQLRALVDARDSGTSWDLRCYVREMLIDYLQKNYPLSLPVVRTEFRSANREAEHAKSEKPEASYARQDG